MLREMSAQSILRRVVLVLSTVRFGPGNKIAVRALHLHPDRNIGANRGHLTLLRWIQTSLRSQQEGLRGPFVSKERTVRRLAEAAATRTESGHGRRQHPVSAEQALLLAFGQERPIAPDVMHRSRAVGTVFYDDIAPFVGRNMACPLSLDRYNTQVNGDAVASNRGEKRC